MRTKQDPSNPSGAGICIQRTFSSMFSDKRAASHIYAGLTSLHLSRPEHTMEDMEILGHMTGAGAARKPAFTLGLNMSNVIKTLSTVEQARALPQGSIVGDPHGGLTFSDAIASALEARSYGGWQEIEVAPGDRWTIIVVNR